MRRYSLFALAVALLFAIGMMAQTSSGSSSSGSTYPGSGDQTNSQSDQSGAYGSQTGNPSNQQPGMGTAGQRQSGTYGTQTDSSQNGTYGSQTGTSQSTSDMDNSSRKGKEKTLEGCVVRQQTDYYIYPKSGQPEHISSSGQSVSEHLGHHVKLHGTEQPPSNTSASSTMGGTTGTAGTSASANTGGNAGGTSGSVSSNTGAGANSGANSSKEFVVDRVDMVSETCPANIQGKATSSGMSTSPQ